MRLANATEELTTTTEGKAMSWEAWGDPPEPQMKTCPDCDGKGVIENGEDAED